MLRPSLVLCLVLVLSGLPTAYSAQTAPVPAHSEQMSAEQMQVDTFLRKWQQTNLVTQDELDHLKTQGKKVLPLLAGYLSDKELGYLAESAMVQLDASGAMPYLLKNLPSKDSNIQRDTFRIANRQLLDYDWYVRSGKPPVDPNASPERYPRNRQPYAYRKELHDAARKLLEAGLRNGAESQAIQTIGLTGNKHDLDLLRQYAVQNGGTQWEGGFYRTVATAALARLGDKQALDRIAQALSLPGVLHSAEAYFTDTGQRIEARAGAVVSSREDGERIREAAFQAGFSMNRRFIPLLLQHMDDPPGQHHGDYSDPSPSYEAMNALSQIVYGEEYASTLRSPEAWKEWDRDSKTAKKQASR